MSEDNHVHVPTVLLIAYHFAPSGAVGAHRSLHFARSLHNAGYDVRIITIPANAVPVPDASLMDVFPFPDRVMSVREAPTLTRMYVNLRRRFTPKHATQDSRRSQTEQPQKDQAAVGLRSSPLRLVRRYVATWDEFPDPFRGWYRRAVRSALQLARERNIHAVFASGPPWTGLLAASTVARKLACPLILDFRDPWTRNTGRGEDLYEFEHCNRLAMRLERRAISEASAVLFNSPEVMRRTQTGYVDLDGVEFRTIPNGSDAPRRQFHSTFPTEGQLHIRHLGSLYKGRTVVPLLTALQEMVAQKTIPAERISVELFGRVNKVESRRLRAADAANIVAAEILPRLPFAAAIAKMMEPALLLVSQPPRFDPQIPTKLYDYLCTGNPVLVLAGDDSATWSLAGQFSRCWRLDYYDSRKNLETLTLIVDKWRSGLLEQERTVEDTSEFTKAATGEQFVSLVDAVLGRRSRAGGPVRP